MRRLSVTAVVSLSLTALAGCAPQSDVDAVRGAEAVADGIYNFGTAVSPGKCLDVDGAGWNDGTQIQEYTCNGSGAQAFHSHLRADGQTELVNTRSGKCVDVDHNFSADFTKVQLWTCNDSAAQGFRQEELGGGAVRIVHNASNKCLDVDGAKSADFTKVQLYTCNNTNAQRWVPAAAPYRVKIMPLGASITAGANGTHAGYRGPLANLLDNRRYQFQYVGSSTDNPGQLPADQQHHEGHPGFVIDSGTSGRDGLQNHINSWINANPDYILILVGSNDVDLNYQLSTAGDRMDTLIKTIRGLRPNTHIIVATIPRINNEATEQRAVAFNNAIVATAKKHEAAGEPVWSVDVHAVVTPADKSDNLHPNDAGYDKIAAAWLGALRIR
jgi:lysophospholipase L1-like esterase